MAAGDIIASRGVQELAGLPFSRLRISARPFSPLFRHLTDNALRGDLSVSRFMCPTCRLHDQVDSRRIADQDKAAGVCYAKGMAAT